MIVGMMVLGIFGFLFYTVNHAAKIQLEKEATQIVNDAMSQKAVKEYVELCIQDVSEEALILLGEQGGRIYDYQGGLLEIQVPEKKVTIPSDYFKDTNQYDVPYLILNELPSSEDFQGIPFYPCMCQEYSCAVCEEQKCTLKNIDLKSCASYGCGLDNLFTNPAKGAKSSECQCIKWSYCSITSPSNLPYIFMGAFNIIPFCDSNGPNPEGLGGASCNNFYIAGLPSSVTGNYLVGAAYGANSLQKQISEYVKNKISDCVDVENLFDSIGYNITQKGDINVSAVMSDSAVEVVVGYPVEISINNKKAKKQANFKKTINVQLKKIFYEIAKRANDIHEYNFNITNSEMPTITIYRNEIPNLKDDLITIEDTASKVKGQNYRFRFMVENRPPALDYLKNNCDKADLCFVEGDLIKLEPTGYDPDDVGIAKYFYEGWMENYTDYFDIGTCLGDVTSCMKDLQMGLFSKYMSSIKNEPKKWTSSEDYDGQNSSYQTIIRTTTTNDIGLHVVNITVFDLEGLKDYQNITILVFDKPYASISTGNEYGDVDDDKASIEDAYILDASASKCGVIAGGNIEKYTFSDETEGIDIESTTPIVYVPEGYQIGSVSIENIETFEDVFPFNNLGAHTITVQVDCISTNTDSEEITVYECLPHRSTTASYPYNGETVNDFQADHTCCLDTPGKWGTYAGISKVCYTAQTYGGIKSFDNVKYMGGDLIPADYLVSWQKTDGTQIGNALYLSQQNTFDWTASTVWSYANDIYERTFERFCNATRGNICGGIAKETRQIVIECNDSNYDTTAVATSTNNVERCSGPAPSIFNTEQSTNPGCYNYPSGTTFEKLFGKTGATGFCKPKECNNQFICDYLCQTGKCLKATNTCLCEFDCGADQNCDAQQIDQVLRCINNIGYKCDSICDFISDGKCLKNSLSGCNADEQCTGKTPGDILCNSDKTYKLCTSGTNACQLEDHSTICLKTPCGASDLCDGKTIGSTTLANSCTGYYKLEINCNNCISSTRNICLLSCNAAKQCNNVQDGTVCTRSDGQSGVCNGCACLISGRCNNGDDCPSGICRSDKTCKP